MEYRLGMIESKFADIIWNNEPLGSGELVKLAFSGLLLASGCSFRLISKARYH